MSIPGFDRAERAYARECPFDSDLRTDAKIENDALLAARERAIKAHYAELRNRVARLPESSIKDKTMGRKT